MDRVRHAEVCGAGLAGLTVGTVLARAGWSVSVNERSEQIREVGAGIYLKNNLLAVLENLGISERVRERGIVLTRNQMRNGNGEILQDHDLDSHRRTWMCAREDLIKALADAAVEAGAELRFNSKIVAATADGTVTNDAGEKFSADVVVAADGVSSTVRERLGLTKYSRRLETLATRYLLPSSPSWPDPITAMHWSGSRRVGVSAVSEAETYVYMICPTDDVAGRSIPIQADEWSTSFPALSNLFQEIADLQRPAIQHQYNVVKCHRWVAGNVALVGDAAHALPPLLGQGGGLAMANSYALGRLLVDHPTSDPRSVLLAWERECRGLTDRTQRWSMRLDTMTNRWPKPLLPVRTGVLWAMGRSSYAQRSMRAAERFDGNIVVKSI